MPPPLSDQIQTFLNLRTYLQWNTPLDGYLQTLYKDIIPEFLAGSSVFMVRKQDSDFSAIFRGNLTGGGLEAYK